MKAPRSRPRKVVSTKSKIQINSNYFITFLVLSCIFAAYQCDAQKFKCDAPCSLRVLHLSWLYTYPRAILTSMSCNMTEFFKRIILSPIYLLKFILCFFKSLILPKLTWFYYAFFDPIIKIFQGIRNSIKSLALTFPHLFLIPLYAIKFLLYPFKWLVSLVSPYAYNECNDNPLKCISHQTAHIFYIPIRTADIIVSTVDDWIQILLDQIRGNKQDEDTFENDQNNTLLQDEEQRRKQLEEEERRRREEEERKKKEQEEEERRRREEEERKRREEEEERKKKEQEEEERRRREEEERRKREQEEEERRRREEEERRKREQEEEERRRREEEERKRREEEERKRREEEEERKRREEEERKRREEEERKRREEEERRRREEEERNKNRVRKEDYDDLLKRYKRVEDNAERANKFTHDKLGCTNDDCNK